MGTHGNTSSKLKSTKNIQDANRKLSNDRPKTIQLAQSKDVKLLRKVAELMKPSNKDIEEKNTNTQGMRTSLPPPKDMKCALT